MAKRRWSDLSDPEKATVLAAASVQLALAATAWADLATRPAEQVNGRKALWAAVIAVNYVGPLAYFTKGRRHAAVHQPTL
jgi:low temperature requirement protein LtrA